MYIYIVPAWSPRGGWVNKLLLYIYAVLNRGERGWPSMMPDASGLRGYEINKMMVLNIKLL